MKNVTHESIWEAILKRMRVLLSEKDMNQAKIAEILHVDRGTITRWLKGDRKASKSNPEVIIGYMRALGMNPADYFASAEQDSSFTEIPWLEASASMGGGSYEGSKEVRSHLSFQTSWLMGKGSPGKMVVINASGGSMEPTIPDGSVVLIDESKKYDLVNNKIYFVCHDSAIFLKRVKLGAGGKVVSLLSDRGDAPIELDDSEYFEVIGQAIWYGKDL